MSFRRSPVVVVGALLAVALLLELDVLTPWGRRAVVDAANIAGSTGVLLLAVRASRRSDGRSSVGWALLAGAGACWTAGNLSWTYYQLIAETQPFPSPADAFYLAAVPFAAAALVAFQVLPGAAAGRARVLLDGVLTSACLLFAAWALLLGPLWLLAQGSVLNQLVVVAYPAVDVALLTLAGGLVVRSRLPRRPSLLLLGGLALYAVGDTNLAVQTLRETFSIGTAVDLGWTAGYACLALAAAAGGSADPARPSARARLVEAAAPYLAVLAAVVVAGTAGVTTDPVLAVLGAVALVLLVVRQALVLSENVALTSGLERAVEARTAELEASRLELSHLAFHDPLTGLVNRSLLRERLGHALGRLGRTSGHCAVLLLDLDDFKTTNDTLGHSYGDGLLVALAGRLSECVRGEDTLARLGGDEFAVVVDRLHRPGDALEVAERVLDATARPLTVDGHDIAISLSIGVVLGEYGDDVDDLLRHADVAMYQAKAAGKGRYTVFQGDMHAEVLDRLSLKADIRRAVRDEEFVVHYQPIVDLASGAITAVEALVRWLHPERGTVPPNVFIPLAEETGVITEIGEIVLRAACTTVQDWRAELGTPLTVNVNVSARQLRDAGFVATVVQVLRETGLPADALTLEITESMLMGDSENGISALHALRELGVHLALDDFGTGYSSLSYLKHLPVDHIKIDKSFIDALRFDDQQEQVWSQAVIGLAQHLGLTVTAEGIEEELQAHVLRGLRCDRGQGFLFARPVPAAELAPLLAAPALA